MLPLSPASRSTFGTSACGVGPRTHLLSPTQIANSSLLPRIASIRLCSLGLRSSGRRTHSNDNCLGDGAVEQMASSCWRACASSPPSPTRFLTYRCTLLYEPRKSSRRQLPVQVGCVRVALGNTYVDPFAMLVPSGAPRPARPPVWTLFTPQVVPHRVARHAKFPSNPTSRMTLSMMLVDLLKPLDPSLSSRTLGLEWW